MTELVFFSILIKPFGDILSFIGLLYIAKVTLVTLCDIIVGIKAHFISKLFKKNFVEKYGKWAIITGCTDGIGRAYSEELAKEGMNLILISRTLEKLKKVSSELASKYKIDTVIIQADFSWGVSIYEQIAEHINKKQIGILVNNVGVMLSHPKKFGQVTDDEMWAHVNVNVGSALAMTKIVLPAMEARKRGAIVNIASIAASGPLPYMGIYSASKAFVDNFSQALEWEYSGSGVTVQTVIPSYVATNMTQFSAHIGTPSLLTPSASVFASHAVCTIGHTKRTCGYWIHGIQCWFAHKVLSTYVFMSSMAYANKYVLSNNKNRKLL